MPVAEPAFGWIDAVVAFGMIVVLAFLVTWVVTDRLRAPRARYVAILLALSLGLGVGYVAWSGTTWRDVVVEDWGSGVLAGLAAAVVAFPLVGRLPARPHAGGRRLAGLLAWEGVAYGIAEAILLSALPVIAVWQAAAEVGWTTGSWATTGSGALAVAAALVVILVHHLGYEEFRSKAARSKLLGALFACGFQALAFLVTGSVLAPIVAHIVLHAQLLLRGVELPPVRRLRVVRDASVAPSLPSAVGRDRTAAR